MTSFSDEFNRQVVPRWHDQSHANGLPELEPLRRSTSNFAADISDLRQQLATEKSVGVAADALNAALVAGDDSLAESASRIILDGPRNLPRPITALAQKVLGLNPVELPIVQFPQVYQQRVAQLRRVLRINPRSAVLQLDLARNLTILGEVTKAGKSVSVALGLSPNNRVVLRAASRFLVTADDSGEGPERALRLLSRSSATSSDPWLIAAEMAIGQLLGRNTRFWRQAQFFLKDQSIDPRHVSELAAAVGTAEFSSGNIKHAKKAFQQAAIAPNENSLAQILWAERRMAAVTPSVPISSNAVPNAFEASFHRAFNEMDMPRALRYAQDWFYSEPFSNIAATATTYVAGLVDDHTSTAKFARYGLYAHRDSACLRNNLLYAEISSGEIFEGTQSEVLGRLAAAVRYLSAKTQKGGTDAIHSMANLGLLLFRLGRPDEGSKCYEHAIESALKSRSAFQAANAFIFYARESILARSDRTPEVMRRTIEIVTKNPHPSLRYYLRKLEAAALDPARSTTIFSLKAAGDFVPKDRPLFRIQNKPDGGLIVWLPPRA